MDSSSTGVPQSLFNGYAHPYQAKGDTFLFTGFPLLA